MTTAGTQAFRSDDFTRVRSAAADRNPRVTVFLITTGTGHVELGTTTSGDEDTVGAYSWTIENSSRKSTDGGNTYTSQSSANFPRCNVVGHANDTLSILESRIVSEPYNGVAYAAGENIEVRVSVVGSVRVLAESLTDKLRFGDAAQHEREASLVTVRGTCRATHVEITGGFSRYHLYCSYTSYTVQSGGVDADGVVLDADPLGSVPDRRIEFARDNRVAMDLFAPAHIPDAGQRVDGSQSYECDAVFCAYVTAYDQNCPHYLKSEPAYWGRILKKHHRAIYPDGNSVMATTRTSSCRITLISHLPTPAKREAPW